MTKPDKIPPTKTGTVKWFSKIKGYGFIVPDEAGKDIFIHATSLEKCGLRTLNEGERVGYDLQNFRGKISATNIVMLPPVTK